jgi:hypothetical protein
MMAEKYSGRDLLADGRVMSAEPRAANNMRFEQYGTARAYTMARLDRDWPDLAARVRAGELSAHAAAIEAGFHKPATAGTRSAILQLTDRLDGIGQLLAGWRDELGRAAKERREAQAANEQILRHIAEIERTVRGERIAPPRFARNGLEKG